jgi:hypothetical protein
MRSSTHQRSLLAVCRLVPVGADVMLPTREHFPNPEYADEKQPFKR